MNLLVTGGAGFIGSAFIRYILQKTDFSGSCINFDLLTYAGNLENLRDVEMDSRYKFYKGDICDQKYVEELCEKHQIDCIVHFAAESHVDRSIHSPHSFVVTNVLGTFSLLEIVKKFKHIHFHHISTDEVYGSLADTGLFTEESPYHPNSPYSASKASSDHLVRAYAHTYGLSTCISNCSNNYGPFQFPEKMIPLMILNCLERKPLPVYGEGLNIRDWLHVEDHAGAIWLLINKKPAGETYNIGGEAERRNIDVVETIISMISEIQGYKKSELESLITFVKDRPGHDYRYAIDCTKIKKLGWVPRHTFEQGLKETIQWYMVNQEWVQNVKNGSYHSWMEENYLKRLH